MDTLESSHNGNLYGSFPEVEVKSACSGEGFLRDLIGVNRLIRDVGEDGW